MLERTPKGKGLKIQNTKSIQKVLADAFEFYWKTIKKALQVWGARIYDKASGDVNL